MRSRYLLRMDGQVRALPVISPLTLSRAYAQTNLYHRGKMSRNLAEHLKAPFLIVSLLVHSL